MKFSTVAVASLLAVPSLATAVDSTSTTTMSVPTSTDTHRYGRFNKTPKSQAPEETGTHRYGRFNKTNDHPSTTGEPVAQAANAAGPGNFGQLKAVCLTAGGAMIGGALLLL